MRVADIKFDDYIQIKSSVYGILTLDYTEVQKMCRDIVAGRRPISLMMKIGVLDKNL